MNEEKHSDLDIQHMPWLTNPKTKAGTASRWESYSAMEHVMSVRAGAASG
jgi:hypothetical protein